MLSSVNSLGGIAAMQDDVVSRAQLSEAGIAGRYLTRRIDGGVWRAVGPRVVILHRGPLLASARRWVAVLHGGPGAALAMWSSAEAEGLRGFEVPELTISMPHGSELSDLEDDLITVRVRQSRRLDAHVHPARLPQRIRLSHALVEAAAEARSTDRLRAALSAAVQQRLILPESLQSAARALPTLPRRKLILATLADIAGGAQSLPEIEYARALRRAKLPAPARQRKVMRPNGTWYLDNEFDPWLVTVEVNGAQHLEMQAREYDDARRLALQQRGRFVVDLSSHLVRERPDEAVLRTAVALTSRGWVPDAPAQIALEAAAARSAWTGWSAA